jgi:hypothetical protein
MAASHKYFSLAALDRFYDLCDLLPWLYLELLLCEFVWALHLVVIGSQVVS